MAVDSPPLRAEMPEKPAVFKGRDDHAGDLGGRRLPRQIKFSALLDATGEERRAVTTRDAPVEAPIAERARQSAEQQEGLLGLGKEVVTLILGHAHPGLVPGPEVVVLPDFDVVSGPVLELDPAANLEVVAPPDVARLDSGAGRAPCTDMR